MLNEVMSAPQNLPMDDPLPNVVFLFFMVWRYFWWGRLLRKWEARNLKRDRELMSLDFLLLDDKDNIIQGSIHHQRIPQFKESIIEGAVFDITNFGVAKCSDRFRLTDHNYMIRFTNQTSIVKVDDVNTHIAQEKFRFRNYNEFMKLADRNEQLPNVIGIISKVEIPPTATEIASRRVVLHLILEERVKVRVTIWEDKVDMFWEEYQNPRSSNNVVIVTNINPKFFGSNLYLNTTSATKFYVNPTFDVVQEFSSSINSDDTVAEISKGSKSNTANFQTFSISEIKDYLSNEDEQEKEIICQAKVASIGLQNGWNYISCSKCAKKLIKTENTLSCNTCTTSQAIGVLRFHIELDVEEGDDRATFVLFDREAQKLINKTTQEIVSDDVVEVGETVPKCIQSIVGRTLKVQVKITAYNLRTKKPSFRIMRFLDNVDNEAPIKSATKLECREEEKNLRNIETNNNENEKNDLIAEDLRKDPMNEVALERGAKTQTSSNICQKEKNNYDISAENDHNNSIEKIDVAGKCGGKFNAKLKKIKKEDSNNDKFYAGLDIVDSKRRKLQ